jgi:hypothetical protein
MGERRLIQIIGGLRRSCFAAVMHISLSCRACGGNSFTIEDARDDSSTIRCRDCDHVVGTLGQVKARVARQVLGDDAI